MALYSDSNSYLLYETKSDYDTAFHQAREEAIYDLIEPTSFYARVYSVTEEALRKSVCRSKKKKERNRHGGDNTILTACQEEAVIATSNGRQGMEQHMIWCNYIPKSSITNNKVFSSAALRKLRGQGTLLRAFYVVSTAGKKEHENLTHA
ncbi:uncharacterized protein RAG0_02914 [Rhynchosporium agropyri]|uniref:Uncharacterized protein n=1 Tax=Rhynchosporium agropyri TaxID=914238 RepID=A0A1E1K2R6_9HELO|nr:uncharacterized protein RAG0_02914 [Rhynchosporium agropyri]